MTNTFSIWMVQGNSALYFEESSIDDVKSVLNSGADVKFWFSKEGNKETVETPPVDYHTYR